MGWGAAIGGIAQIAGQLGSHFLQAAHQRKEADKQRHWLEGQTSSAYQRQVQDLKKAGLNPILSTKLGGAQTGPGAVAGNVSPDINVGAAVSSAQSYLDLKRRNIDYKLERDMYKYYKDRPYMKDAVMTGLLANKIGANPNTAVKLGVATTAKEKLEQMNIKTRLDNDGVEVVPDPKTGKLKLKKKGAKKRKRTNYIDQALYYRK